MNKCELDVVESWRAHTIRGHEACGCDVCLNSIQHLLHMPINELIQAPYADLELDNYRDSVNRFLRRYVKR